MDDGSDSSSIWQRLTRVFHGKQIDAVERAIRDASEDGELDKEEGSMLLSVLTLDELQVQDIMTPRTDIACSSAEDSIRQVAELAISSGHSRIPIFSGNRDNIIGIVHAKDLIRHMLDSAGQDLPATAIMRDPFFVPETKNVLDLLQEFRTRKLHMAVVLDEYGGTAGLVTIEDVLEQIVGDIEDEHDTPREQEVSAQPDGSYLIAGRAYLDDLAETLPIAIESEEVDTLGGYLTHLAGRVPKTGEEFPIDGKIFRIVSSDAKQIHSVRLLAPRDPDSRHAAPGHDPAGSTAGQADSPAQTKKNTQDSPLQPQAILGANGAGTDTAKPANPDQHEERQAHAVAEKPGEDTPNVVRKREELSGEQQPEEAPEATLRQRAMPEG